MSVRDNTKAVKPVAIDAEAARAASEAGRELALQNLLNKIMQRAKEGFINMSIDPLSDYLTEELKSRKFMVTARQQASQNVVIVSW